VPVRGGACARVWEEGGKGGDMTGALGVDADGKVLIE
jgi:hypothetical protein